LALKPRITRGSACRDTGFLNGGSGSGRALIKNNFYFLGVNTTPSVYSNHEASGQACLPAGRRAPSEGLRPRRPKRMNGRDMGAGDLARGALFH